MGTEIGGDDGGMEMGTSKTEEQQYSTEALSEEKSKLQQKFEPIYVKCSFNFNRIIFADFKGSTRIGYDQSVCGKKRKNIFDYIIHTSERAEDLHDADGNSLKIDEIDKMIHCHSKCISDEPTEGNHGSHSACDCAESIKYRDKINSVCGGTVYIPKLTA